MTRVCEQVLQFSTALVCPPAGGFAFLPRHFRLCRDPRPLPRLPTARTCFSELLLPAYSSAADLRQALGTLLREACQGHFSLA
jgi:hypothetical protein